MSPQAIQSLGKDIFISYSREEMDFVTEFEKKLRAAGFTTYRDVVDLRSGESWFEVLSRKINECKYFSPVYSPAYFASAMCCYEMKIGLIRDPDCSKRVVRPVYCKPCDLPPFAALPQYVDFSEAGSFNVSCDRYISDLLNLPAATDPEETASGFIEQHVSQLVSELRGDWLDLFIELALLPITLRGYDATASAEYNNLPEIIRSLDSPAFALLGEPGAGKSTLAKKLVIEYAESGTKVPVFVRMDAYADESDIVRVIAAAVTPALSPYIGRLLGSGKLLVVFDGLNETDLALRDNAARAINRIIKRHRKNLYVLTCRTGEYPTLLREVPRFEVQRIGAPEVRGYFERVLGVARGDEVFRGLPPAVRDLARNPLLLTMLAYLHKPQARPVDVPASKGALYERFLTELYNREETLRSIILPVNVREAFLMNLALRMDNSQVSVRRHVAEQWIEAQYRSDYQYTGITLLTVLHETLSLPPIRVSRPGRIAEADVAFMHQTFQEYYVAKALLNRLDGHPEKIVEYTSPSREQWWQTLSLLVGLVDDATAIVRAIKHHAERSAVVERDQRGFILASMCIRDSNFVQPEEVDDVIIRTMLAYKFGKVQFDHAMIGCLSTIPAERRSANFPHRLIEDIEWYSHKYGSTTPTRLDSRLPVAQLLRYLESDNGSLVIDTLYTLREHGADPEVASRVIERLATATDIVRQQTIAAIGFMAAKGDDAVAALVGVIRDTRESGSARAYALLALGRLGDVAAVPPMIEYLLGDLEFRDSASWGLLGIAKKHLGNAAMIAELKAAYLKALNREKNDRAGRYVKGNVSYSLGEIGAVDCVSEILDWLVSEFDAYVIEDAVYGLGELGDPRAVDLILAYLAHEDVLVRLASIDALRKIASSHAMPPEVRQRIGPLRRDGALVVREAAERACGDGL